MLYTKDKDEPLDKLKVFKTQVELQQGALIKRLRTDTGGEYMGALHFHFVGICYETTAPYTPTIKLYIIKKEHSFKGNGEFHVILFRVEWGNFEVKLC